jgi:ribonuclease HI
LAIHTSSDLAIDLLTGDRKPQDDTIKAYCKEIREILRNKDIDLFLKKVSSREGNARKRQADELARLAARRVKARSGGR